MQIIKQKIWNFCISVYMENVGTLYMNILIGLTANIFVLDGYVP